MKTGADVSNFGAAAEYVATEAAYLTPAPLSIPLEEAAAIPLAALTARQGLFEHIDLQRGQWILINNASGGVGNYAVLLAKWTGAYVIGTTGA